MSMEEMQDLDEQVLAVANRAGEVRRSDESQQEAARKVRCEKVAAQNNAEALKREEEKADAADKQKRFVKMFLRVAGCLLAALVFLTLMLDPRCVPIVGCLGIMTFIVMGAITLDRHIRRER